MLMYTDASLKEFQYVYIVNFTLRSIKYISIVYLSVFWFTMHNEIFHLGCQTNIPFIIAIKSLLNLYSCLWLIALWLSCVKFRYFAFQVSLNPIIWSTSYQKSAIGGDCWYRKASVGLARHGKWRFHKDCTWATTFLFTPLLRDNPYWQIWRKQKL